MSRDTVVDIPLSTIHFDDSQPRADIDPDQLALLQESMRQLGRTVQYITVSGRADGSYLLLSGERRVRAARALGWHYLPAVVIDEPAEPTERLLRQVAENAARSTLRPAELCGAIDRARTVAGPAEIAGAVGLSVRTVYNYLSILEHPDLVEALRQGQTLRSVLAEVAARAEPTGPADPIPVQAPSPPQLRRSVDHLETAWPLLDDDIRYELASRLRPLLDSLTGPATNESTGGGS